MNVGRLARMGIKLWSWPGTGPCSQCERARLHDWSTHWRLFLARMRHQRTSRKFLAAK